MKLASADMSQCRQIQERQQIQDPGVMSIRKIMQAHVRYVIHGGWYESVLNYSHVLLSISHFILQYRLIKTSMKDQLHLFSMS